MFAGAGPAYPRNLLISGTLGVIPRAREGRGLPEDL